MNVNISTAPWQIIICPQTSGDFEIQPQHDKRYPFPAKDPAGEIPAFARKVCGGSTAAKKLNTRGPERRTDAE